jgi:hypothetical protein
MVGDGKTNQLFERGLAQSFCMSSLGTNNGEGASQGMEITQPSSPKNSKTLKNIYKSLLERRPNERIYTGVDFNLHVLAGTNSC